MYHKAIATLFLSLLMTAPSLAAEMKIGYVHTERVFRESQLAVKAQKKLEQEFAKRDQELQKMVKQARDLQSGLEKEALTLAESEKNRRERELANLNREIQRSQREFREDLNMRKNEEFASVHEKARKIIKDIAEKEKYDLIVENVVFASPRVDITEKVLKALER
jgi:outer membrane protein